MLLGTKKSDNAHSHCNKSSRSHLQVGPLLTALLSANISARAMIHLVALGIAIMHMCLSKADLSIEGHSLPMQYD